MEYIAFDSHKKYTYAVVEDEKGWVKWETRGFGCVPQRESEGHQKFTGRNIMHRELAEL